MDQLNKKRGDLIGQQKQLHDKIRAREEKRSYLVNRKNELEARQSELNCKCSSPVTFVANTWIFFAHSQDLKALLNQRGVRQVHRNNWELTIKNRRVRSYSALCRQERVRHDHKEKVLDRGPDQVNLFEAVAVALFSLRLAFN